MTKEKAFPKRLFVKREIADGETYFISAQTPEEMAELFIDVDVAVYELKEVGHVTTEATLHFYPDKGKTK